MSKASSAVENPEKRQELIGVLEELSDRKLQMALWLDHQDYPNSSGIDEVFHLLFDDTDLGADTEKEIGHILLDKMEADKVKLVCEALLEIHERLGDVGSAAFMNDEKWNLIISNSKDALNIFCPARNG